MSQPQNSERTLNDLVPLARRVLPTMIDQRTNLFVHKFRLEAGLPHKEGVSPRYTAMSLIGLLADAGGSSSDTIPGASGRTFDALWKSLERTSDVSLLGAAAWAFALKGDARARELAPSLERLVSPGSADSMSLGLVLSGLAATTEAFPDLRHRLQGFGDRCAAELDTRFSPEAGLFRLGGTLRRYAQMTSFASQVYPIHGLTHRARAFGAEVPLSVERVAAVLVEAQGPLGQWWWLYSSRTGTVLEGYPVYSVHQDAMAYMALFPLHSLGIASYERQLSTGLQWLFGRNELGVSLVSPSLGILRAIQRRSSDSEGAWGLSRGNRVRMGLASRGLRAAPGTFADRTALEVLRECRPYHLGWLLYAYSLIRDGRKAL